MKTIELKDLCGCLPYELKAISVRTNEVRTVTLWHYTYDLRTVGLNHLLFDGILLEKHKPILLPLSALTEQLPDGSIPIDVISDFNVGHVDFITHERDHWIDYYGREGWIGKIPYRIIEYLFANHFDIYDLIGQGLAIDKRTVKL